MAEWLGRSGVTLVTQQLTAAGKAVLTKAIKRAGWQVEEFALAHPNDLPASTRAVVALGDEALYDLTGWKGGKRAGKYTRGYLLPSYTGLPVIPTFDPGKVAMGQMKLLGLLMQDLGVAMQASVGARKVCVNPKALVDYRIGLQALKDLYAEAAADPTLLVAFDLETATSWEEDEDESIEFSRDAESDDDSGGLLSRDGDGVDVRTESNSGAGLSRDALDIGKASIRTVQFSLRPGTGVSCDWSDECRDWVQRIMSLPNPFAGHNIEFFDRPIMERHGIVFNSTSPIYDTIIMARHHQPDLPLHLQGVASWINFPFPWKHMSGSDLDFYGSCDVDVVQWIMRDLPRYMKMAGIWEGYDKYDRKYRTIVSKMEKRGIPVSKQKLMELRTWLNSEVGRMDGELQVEIPGEMKGRKYWKTWPADTKELMTKYKQLLAQEIKIELIGQGKKVTKKALNFPVKIKDMTNPLLGHSWTQKIRDLGYEFDKDQLYKELDFNPRSSQQIIKYLKARGYPVPKKFADGKDTTGDKGLEALEAKTKDPVLRLTRSIRAYGKLENAYTGKLQSDGSIEGGWMPGPDGRLRATIAYKSTGQLAAKNPNTMTLPKRRKELAKKFRQCIEAPPGYKLIEFDYKAFHSLTTALESRDKVMYRLAPLDPHSFVTGHLVKFSGIETCLSLSDADLKAYLDEIKKRYPNVRDFQAKPAAHGTNFGQSAKRLYFEYSEHFENQKAAERLLDLMRSLFPNLFSWQERIIEKADDEGKLISKWGYVRRFWDAMVWQKRYSDGKWIRKRGKGAPAAMAFLPANDAHIMMRDKEMQAEEKGWLDRYGFVNSVHDALWFLCPTKLVDECKANMVELLESPVPQLADSVMCPDGFICRVDGTMGDNLGEMEALA